MGFHGDETGYIKTLGLNGDLEENIQLLQGKLQFQTVEEACSTVQVER